MTMSNKLTIVTNLDTNRVSWAEGFCSAAKAGGAEVSRDIMTDGTPQLLIGDEIDWERTATNNTAYFLAATDGTQCETENVWRSQFTTTVSRAEKIRTERFFDATDHIFVDGFPLNTAELDTFRIHRKIHSLPTIGFIGRSDADKGPERELLVAAHLKKLGVNVIHISNTMNALTPFLEQLGVEVYQQVSREEYLSRLATLGCVVNTSPRESLFVSGLEAASLGVPVIAPRVSESGITDWNLAQNMYDPDNVEEAAHLAVSLATSYGNVPDVCSYSSNAYVERIAARFEGNNND
jgi:glycosyltransferase involved in cell wall biosynthesis